MLRSVHFLFLMSLVLLSFKSEANSNNGLRFGLGASYTLAAEASGDLNISQLSTNTRLAGGELVLEPKNGLSLDLDLRYSPVNNWGFILGVSNDFKTKLDKMKIKSGNTTTEFSDLGNDKIKATSFMLSAVYRWEKFYIPFGLNYTTFGITPKDDSFSASGGIGIQIGAGFWITNNLVGEFLIRSSTIDLELRDTDQDLKMVYEDATYTRSSLGLKYFF